MEQSLKRLAILKSHVKKHNTAGVEGKVHFEIKEDIRAAIITWDFPKTLNALSKETIAPLVQYLDQVEGDDRVGVVILTGVNNTFSAGANITGFQEDFKFTGGVKFKSVLMKDWARPINEFSKPIIAVINGYCFGGGLEVALMCDIMIASDQANFALPEIKLGLIPGAGGTQALIRNVGKSKAMEMILTGNPITAEDALACNLISKVVPHDKLMEEALNLAKKIGKLSLPSVASAKKCVRHAYESTLSQGVEYERSMFNALTGTQDVAEGVSAFLSKRKPVWSHQ